VAFVVGVTLVKTAIPLEFVSSLAAVTPAPLMETFALETASDVVASVTVTVTFFDVLTCIAVGLTLIDSVPTATGMVAVDVV